MKHSPRHFYVYQQWFFTEQNAYTELKFFTGSPTFNSHSQRRHITISRLFFCINLWNLKLEYNILIPMRLFQPVHLWRFLKLTLIYAHNAQIAQFLLYCLPINKNQGIFLFTNNYVLILTVNFLFCHHLMKRAKAFFYLLIAMSEY